MNASAPSLPHSPATPVPSSQRPIPLRGRLDLYIQQIDFRGAPWWVIKDTLALKYYRLPAEQYCVMKLLDGKTSLKEIRKELSRQFPALFLQLADVQRMITSLHQQGLLWNERPGQSASLFAQQRKLRQRKLLQTFGSLLSIRLPGWDPDVMLRRLDRRLGWLFHPFSLWVAGLLVVASWLLMVAHFDEFRDRLPEFRQFFGWQNLFWLWLTLGVTKVLHEFGHGLTCRHFGSECHEMGVMVLVFSPTLYCDVTDSWMLRDKWQRIAIAAGGMGGEIVLSSVAVFIWWLTTPGLLNHLCLNVFFITTLTTVMFNANPLMRYDGYYMLSDWLGVPNLRERASNVLRDMFAQSFGIVRPHDPLIPEGKDSWFAMYALAAALYGLMILCAVMLFLYATLKQYGLQNVGAAFAIFSLTGLVSVMLVGAWRILTAPRSEPVNSIRATFTVAILLGLAAAALALPLPWFIEAPCLVEPHDVVNILTAAPGQLTEFAVRPGDNVQQGQLLVRLRDFTREDVLRKLQVSRLTQLSEVAMLHALEQFSEHALAVKHLETIDRAVRELDSQLQDLTIRAPISGRVVAAPSTPEPVQDSRRHLYEWHGNIGDPKNLGCLVKPRTHLLSIAPNEKMQVLLFLDQAHREDLIAHQLIGIRFDHLPGRTYTARVLDISREHTETVPQSLSSKSGGTVASVTDETGREQLTSVAYQARVILERETQLLKPGMRGTARFFVEKHSALGWLWRTLRHTFHFRI